MASAVRESDNLRLVYRYLAPLFESWVGVQPRMHL